MGQIPNGCESEHDLRGVKWIGALRGLGVCHLVDRRARHHSLEQVGGRRLCGKDRQMLAGWGVGSYQMLTESRLRANASGEDPTCRSRPTMSR